MDPTGVKLVIPTSEHEAAFLAAVDRSRELHLPFVEAPDTGAAFQQYVNRLRTPHQFGFLLVEPGNGGLAGVVNVSEVVRGCFQSGYLGYYAFVPWARRGLMTHGLAQVLEWAFRDLGLNRLEANIQPENEASIGLVRKLGFRCEGYSPRYLKIAGEWRDHERWAILHDEWSAREQSRPGVNRENGDPA